MAKQEEQGDEENEKESRASVQGKDGTGDDPGR